MQTQTVHDESEPVGCDPRTLAAVEALAAGVFGGRPIRFTLPAHAKLIIALGLAADAAEELTPDDGGEGAAGEGDAGEEDAVLCGLRDDAVHIAWQLRRDYGLLTSACRDLFRVRRLQERLGEVLDGWLAAEVAPRLHVAGEDVPEPDAVLGPPDGR